MANSNQADPTKTFYLDDLHVGQRFVSGTHRSTKNRSRRSRSSSTLNRFISMPRLRKVRCSKGLWQAAGTLRLLPCGSWWKAVLPIAGGIIGAGGEISWPKPTRPGAVLRVESEIIELRPSRSRPDRGLATIRSETRNQLGEIVQVLTPSWL